MVYNSLRMNTCLETSLFLKFDLSVIFYCTLTSNATICWSLVKTTSDFSKFASTRHRTCESCLMSLKIIDLSEMHLNILFMPF